MAAILMFRAQKPVRSGDLSYNLGQNKWKTYTTPPRQIKDGKMARFFALRAASSLISGGWGFSVPFYFVQDCR